MSDSREWEKGRLILSDNKKARGRQKLLVLIALIGTSVVVPLYVLSYLFTAVKEEGTLEWLLFVGLFSAAYAVAGAYVVSLARSIRPLHLYENGLDNFCGRWPRLSFKRFEEFESARIRVEEEYDWAAVDFWIKGPLFRYSNSLVFPDEDIRKEKVREIAEFLKSKGMKLSYGGEAKDWVS